MIRIALSVYSQMSHPASLFTDSSNYLVPLAYSKLRRYEAESLDHGHAGGHCTLYTVQYTDPCNDSGPSGQKKFTLTNSMDNGHCRISTKVLKMTGVGHFWTC